MLPDKYRYALFEKLSVKTMRYVDAVPVAEAEGLLAEIYQQIAEDFFINGSLTSHSLVPELLAGVWIAGREAIIQPDLLDQMTKEAMAATLSRVNDCPYCGDMLVSLVHSAGERSAASAIFQGTEQQLAASVLQQRLCWVEQVGAPGADFPDQVPFSRAQLPEAIATLIAMGHINRYSHVVMAGSPVPFGQSALKRGALSMFAGELTDVVGREQVAGRSLPLAPEGQLPEGMDWLIEHPRLADAFGRWSASNEQHAAAVIPEAVRLLVQRRLQQWDGARMPLSRGWVEEGLHGLAQEDQHIARLILIVAMASYQFSEDLVKPLLTDHSVEQKRRLVAILNYAAFSGTMHLGKRLGAFYLGGTANTRTLQVA